MNVVIDLKCSEWKRKGEDFQIIYSYMWSTHIQNFDICLFKVHIQLKCIRLTDSRLGICTLFYTIDVALQQPLKKWNQWKRVCMMKKKEVKNIKIDKNIEQQLDHHQREKKNNMNKSVTIKSNKNNSKTHILMWQNENKYQSVTQPWSHHH